MIGLVSRLSVVACLLLLMSGCTEDGVGSTQGPRDQGGPLSAQSGEGATVGTLVAHQRQGMTFGAFLLCTTEPGAVIHVDAVRYETNPEPSSVEVWFRHLPAAENRPDPRDSVWFPYVGVKGIPPSFTARDVPQGKLTRTLGDPITASCEGYSTDDAATELMTAMTVNRRGGMVRNTFVDYHVGDDEYTLTIPWHNGICGTAMPRQYRCEK